MVVVRAIGARRSPSPAGLARFLRRVASRVPPGAGSGGRFRIDVALVGDRRIRALNLRYRGKDSATDVLAFPSGERLPDGGVHLGDLAVSVATAGRQASRRGHSPATEVRILLLHGYLHLLGRDHESDGGAMRRLERRLARELLPGAKGEGE